MDRRSDRQSEVNKYLWSIYARPRMSRKKKFLLAVLGVIILGIVVGFDEMLRVAAIAIPIALFVGLGFWVGFEIGEGNGVLKGEAAERKRMLDEGYSLGYHEPLEADDDAKPLRTCRNCGHIIDDD
jgi:hypothetical protein